MKIDTNIVVVQGNMARDPHVFDNGTVAVTIANNGGETSDKKEIVNFIPAKCFGKTAEFAKNYLKKGSGVIAEGKLSARPYTNKEGQTITTLEFIVDSFRFAGGKRQDNGAAPDISSVDAPASGEPDEGFINVPYDDEEAPF